MRARGFALIIAANLIGGLTYLGQKQAMEALPPGIVTFLRNLVAIVAMALLLAARGGFRSRYDRAALTRLCVAGVLAFAMPLWLGTLGLRWSTAGNASILILLEPGAILVFSVLLLKERIGRPQQLGVAFGMAGALFIVLDHTSGSDLLAGGMLLGNSLLLLHAVLWGLYSPVMKPLADKHPALELTLLSMLFSMLLLTPIAGVEWLSYEHLPGWETALLWVAGLGLIGSFLGTLWWNASLKVLRASTIAPFVLLQPLAGLLGDWLVRDEVPTRAAWTGAGLIVTGLLCVLVSPRAPVDKRNDAAPPLEDAAP
ncbi:MAG: membrane protein [Planctomycetota bacterium]|nr:MAG: membrane protein [Planctomycetota bacterium]